MTPEHDLPLEKYHRAGVEIRGVKARHCVVLAAVAATLLAGCGGADSDARLSEAEFRAQANDICADLEDDLDAIGQPQSLEELQPRLQETRTVFANALTQLRSLRPPEDAQADYDRLLATGDEALQFIDKMQRAAAQGDVTEVQRVAEEADRADTESDEIAMDLGLDACATD